MANSVIKMDRDTIVDNTSRLSTTDGRYYSCHFSVEGSRSVVLVARSNQGGTDIGIMVILLRNDGVAISNDERVSNPSTGVLRIDCGSSAWTAPMMIHGANVTITW